MWGRKYTHKRLFLLKVHVVLCGGQLDYHGNVFFGNFGFIVVFTAENDHDTVQRQLWRKQVKISPRTSRDFRNTILLGGSAATRRTVVA